MELKIRLLGQVDVCVCERVREKEREGWKGERGEKVYMLEARITPHVQTASPYFFISNPLISHQSKPSPGK